MNKHIESDIEIRTNTETNAAEYIFVGYVKKNEKEK